MERSRSLGFISFGFILLLPLWTQAEGPQRKKELDSIANQQAENERQEEAKVEHFKQQLDELQVQIDQREKTIRDIRRMRGNPQRPLKALKELQAKRTSLQDQMAEEGRPFEQRREELEQKRRHVVKKFPEPGDPDYLDFHGRLLTAREVELEEKKAAQELELSKSKNPVNVAQEYIDGFVERRILRSAVYTQTRGSQILLLNVREFEPRAKGAVDVHYTAEYVSVAGIVNERDVCVRVITLDGEHWIVYPRLRSTGSLIGLP